MIGMVINRALVEFESGYHHVKNVVGERLVNGVWMLHFPRLCPVFGGDGGHSGRCNFFMATMYL